MFFKQSKRFILVFFGLFYSIAIITIASTIEYSLLFLRHLSKAIPPLLKGLAYGCLTYCAFCTAAAAIISLVARVPPIPLLLSALSPYLLLSHFSILVPILPLLPFAAISLPLLYVGIGLAYKLGEGLPHCVMDFYDKSFKEGLLSPLKYYYATMKATYTGDNDPLCRYLESRAVKIQEDIVTNHIDHIMSKIQDTHNTTSTILRQFLPNAVADIITQYAHPHIPYEPREVIGIPYLFYLNWMQKITLYAENKFRRSYGLSSGILRSNINECYNTIHQDEILTIFKKPSGENKSNETVFKNHGFFEANTALVHSMLLTGGRLQSLQRPSPKQ